MGVCVPDGESGCSDPPPPLVDPDGFAAAAAAFDSGLRGAIRVSLLFLNVAHK
jgi:hypothetical protein